MRVMCVFVILLALFICPQCWAEETASSADMERMRAKMEELQKAFQELKRRNEAEVGELKERINELEERLEKADAGIVYEDTYEVGASGYEAPPPSGRGLWQSFNPDISVVGDVLAEYTSHENDGDSPDDQFIFRELEMNFSGVLDPFARADATVAIHRELEHVHEHDEEEHDEEHECGECEGRPEVEHKHDFAIDIEEAYLTTLSLPYGLQARVGRMKERFGKINAVHLHALPWVDYPLMIKNYFGGEGLVGDGAELSWLAPTPFYLEVLYEIFNNDNAASFAGEEFDDVVHLGHIKSLFELNEAATLEAGGTLATGPNDDAHGADRTWLEGIDVTLKWRPPEEGLYRGITWQTEALFSQKDTGIGEAQTWGLYSSLEYQLSRSWTAAARYDYSEFPDCENLREQGYSAYITFNQSEFVFWRLGYMFVDRNFEDPEGSGEDDEHIVWLQLDFGLGPHRAHAY